MPIFYYSPDGRYPQDYLSCQQVAESQLALKQQANEV